MVGPAGPVAGPVAGSIREFPGPLYGPMAGPMPGQMAGDGLANANPYYFWSLDCQRQPMADQWPDHSLVKGQVQLLGQWQGQWNPRISRATILANGKANVSSNGNGRSNGQAIYKITCKISSHLFLSKPLLLPGPFHVFHALSRPPPSPPVNIRDLPSKKTYHRQQPIHLHPLPPSSWPSCRGAEHIVIPSLTYPSTNHGRQPSSEEEENSSYMWPHFKGSQAKVSAIRHCRH